VFPHPRCPANSVSGSSCIFRKRSALLSGTYKFPLYRIRPSSTLQYAMVISFRKFLVRIASCILPGNGSLTYATVIWSEIEWRPWAGGLSAYTHHCAGRFRSFRTTCSRCLNHASPPSGRSPGLLIKASAFPLYFASLYIIWWSNWVEHSDDCACHWFCCWFVIPYSKFLRSVNNWRGYAARSHWGLHSWSALMIAIRSMPYISWLHSASVWFFE